MRKIILGLTILASSIASAQEVKQEVEKRIDAEEMPPAALDYLNTLRGTKRKLHFYMEHDGEHQSYEAKFKIKHAKYSVEFNSEGQLEDIEILQTPKKMGSALTAVKQYLETNFERYRIEKIQSHFEKGQDFDTSDPGNPDAWELIVATKNSENKLERFEMTFDVTGKYLKSRKVVRRSYEFLLF